MKHFNTMMIAALAAAALATPANAETNFTPYIGFAAEMRSDIDPNDYEHVAREFTTRRDGSGAAGIYAGVRRGRLGLEGGWMFEKTTRWQKTTDAMGEILHRSQCPRPSRANGPHCHSAEIDTGGPYVVATFDVLAISEAHLYLKGGLTRANRWKTTIGEWESVGTELLRHDQTTGSGGSGTIATTGAGIPA